MLTPCRIANQAHAMCTSILSHRWHVPEGMSTQQEFRRLLDRPKVQLDHHHVSSRIEGDLVVEHILLNTEEGHQAPLQLVKLAASVGPLPVLLLLHGTGKSNKQLSELGLFERFARRCYLVVGMDNRYHGERLPAEKRVTSPAEYYIALERAYLAGGFEKPFIYDNVWDLMRVIDYLEKRADVDAARIGCTGISLGGMHSWFLSLADDRVGVIAPAIGVQYFKYAIEHNLFQARVDSIPTPFEAARKAMGKTKVDGEVVTQVWSTITPGLLEKFDAPMSLGALAPRPLLVLNGEDDARCPADGVRIALESARAAYANVGAQDSIDLFIEPGVGHDVTELMWARVEAFLDKFLKSRITIIT